MPTIDEITYVFNALPAASIIVRANAPYFTIAAVNSAFLKSTNSVLQELIGHNFFEQFPKKTNNEMGFGKIFKAFEQVLKSKQPYQIKNYKYSYQFAKSDHHPPTFWKIHVYPLLDQYGNVEYIVQSLEDDTESKKSHEKLLASESRLRSLVNVQKAAKNALKSNHELYNYINKATNDAIYDWDIIQDHLEWGEAFSRIFGYQTNEGQFPIEKWSSMVHPDDISATNESLTQLLNNKNKIHWAIEYRLKKANGEYAFVQENGYVLRSKEGVAIRMIGVLQDITQRVEHELKRVNYIHSIEQRNVRLRDIAWAQAHLVRPPLARIMGIVQLLSDEETSTDHDKKQLLSYLDISAKELDEIVKDIINKSRI